MAQPARRDEATMVQHTFKIPTDHAPEVAHAALRKVLGPLRCPQHGGPPRWAVRAVAGGVAVNVRTCCDDFDAVCRAALR